MKIGIYTTRINPQVGGYNHFRIIHPLLKELYSYGMQLYLLKDLPTNVLNQFGTSACFEWTKYINPNHVGEYFVRDCDVLFILAVAYESSSHKRQLRNLIETFDFAHPRKPILYYDTDADFDMTSRESRSALVRFQRDYHDRFTILSPFDSMRHYYYRDRYSKHYYLPYPYDPDYEVPYVSIDQRQYLTIFPGTPIWRPYLADGLYFVAKRYPNERIQLYGKGNSGSGFLGFNPGWAEYDFLSSLPNVEAFNRYVYKSDRDFYQWLSNCKVGVHVAGGNSYGYVQRLLDYLYAGCLMICDYFDEIKSFGLDDYRVTSVGSILDSYHQLLSMTDEQYKRKLDDVRSRVNLHSNKSIVTKMFLDIILKS